MIENLPEFNRWVSQQVRKTVPEQVEVLHRRIAGEVLNRVVLNSPVGNPSYWADPSSAPPGYVGGRFRNNWQIGPAPTDEEIPPPTGTVPPLQETLDRENSALRATAAGIGRTIWVFNNVPYAERLENGWSSMAPQGVVGPVLGDIVAGRRQRVARR